MQIRQLRRRIVNTTSILLAFGLAGFPVHTQSQGGKPSTDSIRFPISSFGGEISLGDSIEEDLSDIDWLKEYDGPLLEADIEDHEERGSIAVKVRRCLTNYRLHTWEELMLCYVDDRLAMIELRLSPSGEYTPTHAFSWIHENYDINSVYIKGNTGDNVQWIYADKKQENHELRVINQFDEYDPYKGIVVM